MIRHAVAIVLLATPALAHDGPPFPILVDQEVAGRTLSVWADPDVGVGTFYIYIPEEEDAPDPSLSLVVHARPLDGAFEERSSTTERADSDRPYQRVVKVDFPDRGMWNVRFVLEAPEGKGELATDVDVTPPGLGKFTIFWYLSPFVLFGFVWLKALFGRRSRDARNPT